MSALTFEDGPDWFDERTGVRLGSYNDWVDSLAAGKGYKRGTPKKSPKAVAYVNHGRWVADCPLGDGGARRLKPGLEFFCIECGNTFEVEWPDAETMKSVEAGLAGIPGVTNQNFDPRVT